MLDFMLSVLGTVTVGERSADDQRRGPRRPARVDNDRGDGRCGRGNRPSSDRTSLEERLADRIVRLEIIWRFEVSVGRRGGGRQQRPRGRESGSGTWRDGTEHTPDPGAKRGRTRNAPDSTSTTATVIPSLFVVISGHCILRLFP